MVYKNQRQSISHVMTSGTKKKDDEYKGRMLVILGVVRFLLLQAHAFRGHEESSTSSNKGNFLELIEWYKAKDKDVAHLLHHNQMTSPDIQKDLCKACAQKTTLAIIADLGDRHFSILVDEARDASIKEQMDVVLRYVNSQGQVIERFLGLENVANTTSSSLKKALDGMFAFHGLSISRLRGQGYDGASNMRGEFHGLQRLILNENPYAFYIHCFAHQLQLVVVSVAKCCSSVFDFFHTSTLIVNTVNASCKRRDQLAKQHHENLVSQLENGEIFSGREKNQETNLARPGNTRWGSHHKTLCRIVLMWDAVLEVLEIVADDASNGDKKYMASGLLKQMECFEFVLIVHLMIRLLGITNDLSQCLQIKDQNIVRAVGLIGTTLQKINDIRENGWEDLFEEVKTFCFLHRIIIPNMEDSITVRGRSRGRGGQLVTYYHHFKNEIFNVVHDQIIVELNNRFAERPTQLLRCIACLDPRNSFANYDRGKLLELAKMYAADFSQYDLLVLREQLDIFIDDARVDPIFTSCHDLGNLAIKMVQTDRHNAHPLVYRLIELALILPVATATVERAFSAMKIIKTELRNKMSNDWLNHRMVCYIERDTFASLTDADILYHFQELESCMKKLPRVPPFSASGSVSRVIVDEDMRDSDERTNETLTN
uniref:HAT C-terminal dimerisation domain-containing protein n=1 Tax=Arundo donax TaxID=35708 RepID=A0A0A9E7R8_ARUDO